jgi:sensor domain CHASE-containing protein
MSSDSDTTLISRGRLLRLLAAFAVFVALGVAFNYMYYRFSDHELDVKHFSNTLHEREAYADAELKKIRTRVNQNGLWNVAHMTSISMMNRRRTM